MPLKFSTSWIEHSFICLALFLKKLIEAITERIKKHESDADLFKDEPIVFNMEEMLLRIADEGNAIIELVEGQSGLIG